VSPFDGTEKETREGEGYFFDDRRSEWSGESRGRLITFLSSFFIIPSDSIPLPV